MDKMLLLLAGMVASSLLALSLWFLNPLIGEDWTRFVVMSAFYLIILCYLVLTSYEFSKTPKSRIILIVLTLGVFVIGMGYLAITYKFIPMPKSVGIYVLLMTLLSIASMHLLKYCVEHWDFLKSSNNRKEKG